MKFKQGMEHPDPTPLEIPLGFKKPPSIQELIQQGIRTQLSTQASNKGYETFDEANDFDVEEDDAELRPTNYEYRDMVPEVPHGQHLDPDSDVDSGDRNSSGRTGATRPRARPPEDDQQDDPEDQHERRHERNQPGGGRAPGRDRSGVRPGSQDDSDDSVDGGSRATRAAANKPPRQR